MFAPAALGAVLNDATIPCLRCRVVCGGANNQLAEVRHDAALAVRGIVFVPTIWRMQAASSTSIRKPSTTSPTRCSLRSRASAPSPATCYAAPPRPAPPR